MKRFNSIFLIAILITVFCACESKELHVKPHNGLYGEGTFEEALEFFGEEELIEYVTDSYDLEEALEGYVYNDNDYYCTTTLEFEDVYGINEIMWVCDSSMLFGYIHDKYDISDLIDWYSNQYSEDELQSILKKYE